jgi:acyl carrier protein
VSRADLVDLVAQVKGDDPADLLDLDPIDLDSIDLVELAVLLERAYGIELGTQPGDLEALGDLDVLVALVEARRRR